MSLTAGPERMMCRIDPALHAQEVQKQGCTTVIMRGRTYKGYVYIDEIHLQDPANFQHWIGLALAFNDQLVSGDEV